MMEKKAIKLFMRWSRSSLPRSARDSKQRDYIHEPCILGNWSDKRYLGDHPRHFKSHLIPG
jgi:hypothetical protein